MAKFKRLFVYADTLIGEGELADNLVEGDEMAEVVVVRKFKAKEKNGVIQIPARTKP